VLAHGFTERFDALVRIEAKVLRDGLKGTFNDARCLHARRWS
jgi:hypothetical protein